MSDCAQRIPAEQMTAYWAGDLPDAEVDRLDEHLMACPACAAEAERVARVVLAIRSQIPPFVTAAQVAELRARGLRVEENVVGRNDRHPAVFRPGIDLLIHRLSGLELGDVAAVSVRVVVEGTGEVVIGERPAPFEREAGEVWVACQRHFAAFPPDIVFEVRSRPASGEDRLARFEVPHVFA